MDAGKLNLVCARKWIFILNGFSGAIYTKRVQFLAIFKLPMRKESQSPTLPLLLLGPVSGIGLHFWILARILAIPFQHKGPALKQPKTKRLKSDKVRGSKAKQPFDFGLGRNCIAPLG